MASGKAVPRPSRATSRALGDLAADSRNASSWIEHFGQAVKAPFGQRRPSLARAVIDRTARLAAQWSDRPQ